MRDETGFFLVKLARNTVERELGFRISESEKMINEELDEKRGAFVTLETYPEKKLRGCIGYPYPYKKLIEAVRECAIAAAFHDYRFPELEKEELDSTIFEVSILTKPEEIAVDSKEELVDKIIIGKHGLMLQSRSASGLLLPQVPLEFGWSPREFLEHLCIKAGVERNYWKREDVKILWFESEIFAEEEPRGRVLRRELGV